MLLVFLATLLFCHSRCLASKLKVSSLAPAADNVRAVNYQTKHPTEHFPEGDPYQEHHHLEYQLPYGADNLADGIVEGEGWEEEDGWWDGVEEIDLTQPSQYNGNTQLYLVPLAPVEQELTDQSLVIDCGGEAFCDIEMFPPPPKLAMPPPPLPPFMPGLVNMIRRQSLEVFIGVPPQSHCSLCQWAYQGNSSLTTLMDDFGEFLNLISTIQLFIENKYIQL